MVIKNLFYKDQKIFNLAFYTIQSIDYKICAVTFIKKLE